jgi:WD40 repeat protein
MSVRPQFDLFVSYAEADREWVEGYLLDALEQAGVRVHSEAAFALGMPRVLEFERAVTRSRRVLLVLSPAYLVDETTGFVDLLAQSYGDEVGTWPVIPLLLEPVSLPPRLKMLTGIDATDPAQREQVVARLGEELGKPVPPPAPLPPCPYPGMRPFAEADAPFFHGREEETEDLVQRIAAQQGRERRFLAVIGPSGSGKSSLVFAGLVPKLRTSNRFGPGEWSVLSVRPGPAPMAAPTVVLGTDPPLPGPTFADLIAAPPEGRLLLVVDQFEELFTVARQRTPEDEAPFQEAVLGLAERPTCFVVLTVRADFYPDLMGSPLWPQIQAHRAEVLPLGEAGLRRAIINPAERVGVYVEAALVERLAADAAGEPGVLPLVQQTLVLLWERLERRFLPLRAYEALVLPRAAYGGPESADETPRTGLQVAVARHADATVAELDPEQQTIARRIFLRLVQPNEGRAATRRQRRVDELRSVGEDPARFAATLEHLVANRLVTLSGGEEAAGRTVDLAHEALIGGWPWLQQLVIQRGEAIRARQRLEDKTAEWVRLGKGRGGLLDEAELAEAERWLASPDAAELGYGEDLPALVHTSRAELARELQRLQRRFVAAAAFAALALVAAVVALYGFRRANDEANARATEVIVRSTAEANALANEQQANEAQDAAETAAREAGRQSLRAEVARQTAEAERNRADEQAGTAVAERAVALAAAATAEAERVRADEQAGINLAQALTAQALIETGRGEHERGALVARQAYLVDEMNGGPVRDRVDPALRTALSIPHFSHSLRGHVGLINTVAFAPDGRTLVSADSEGAVQLWDLTNPESVPTLLEGHDEPVTSVAFAPDGQTLASGSQDGTVRLWDFTNPAAPPAVLEGHDHWVPSVAFSPDGQSLASGSWDRTVRVWDLTDPAAAPAVLEDHEGPVFSIAFAPDGQSLASSDTENTVRVWDPARLEVAPVVLVGYEGEGVVSEVAFTPDGQSLATSDTDGTVRVWDLTHPADPPAILEGYGGSVAFAPDGQTLASGIDTKTVRVWDLARPEADPVVLAGQRRVSTLAFAPDGKRLASGGVDGTVRVWNLVHLDTAPAVLKGHEGLVSSVAFARMDDSWPPAVRMRRCGCGISLIPLIAPPSWQVTKAGSPPSPSPRMGRSWPRAVRIGQCDCGISPIPPPQSS